MKKWIFLLLAMVLVVNLLVMGIGCKPKEEAKPPETAAPAQEEAKPAEPAPAEPATTAPAPAEPAGTK